MAVTGRSRRPWWWLAGLGFGVTAAAVLTFSYLGDPSRLDAADKLSSIGSLVVGVAALATSGIGLWRAVRPGSPAPPVPDAVGGHGGHPQAVGRVWNVPPPVRTFVGRETILDTVARGPNRMVLYGPPGVGKSQLGLAWAHRHADTADIGWRVRATDAVTATADLADLADALGVGDQDGGRAAANAIAELGRRTGWLLIFDDAPEPAAIADWLPHRGGRVLITSRNPSWESVGIALEVPPFDARVAAGFLQDRASDGDPANAGELAAVLGGLPLALEQAGAYCRNTGRSLSSYLALYQAAGGARLLEHGAPDGYAPGPVTVTVRLAIRLAARRNPAAVQLLRLMAFLAPSGIPRDLASTAPSVLPRPLRQTAADPVRLDQAIKVLIEAALAAPDQPGQLRVHQLVQEILRRPTAEPAWWRRAAFALRLPGADRAFSWSTPRWAKAATQLLTAALPTDPTDPANWDRLTALTPHAQALIVQADRHSTDAARLRISMNSLALRLRDIGALDGARQLAEQIVQVRRRLLGDGHPDTLASMNDLAAILRATGNLPAARRLVEHTLHTRQRLLGDEHPETRAAGRDLADVLGDMESASDVFVSLGRRSQLLVDRLIGHLDRLERDEEDPDRLAELFQLDHLLTRLRRNDENLLVLAGADNPRVRRQPAPLTDVIRAAQSEIELYTRIEFGTVDHSLEIAAPAVNDLVGLISELLDNATMFSPPDTMVMVDAVRGRAAGAIVRIEDRGLGISPDQLSRINDQLARPPSIYSNPAQIGSALGLHVVARLAAAHGVRVRLASRASGAIATVTLPDTVLTTAPIRPPAGTTYGRRR